MFRNYLKLAVRNLKRHKTFAVINIAGLAIGMSACLLIACFVMDELSFDRYHEGAERLYRVVMNRESEEGDGIFRGVPAPLASVLKTDFPQVDGVTRFWQNQELVISAGDIVKSSGMAEHAFVDTEIFEVFTIPFVYGRPETALNQPFTVVISEEVARLFFGTTDALDQIFTINEEEYTVTGVFEAIPHNSHLPKVNFLTSFQTVADRPYLHGWDGGIWISTYVKLDEDTDLQDFESELEHAADLYAGEELALAGVSQTYALQPVTEIHLHPNVVPDEDILSNKTIRLVFFSTLAMLTLMVACLNFVNLMTARSTARYKEVGVRKTSGASRSQLIVQFIGESLLISILAMCLALFLTDVLLPWLNVYTGKELAMMSLPLPILVGVSVGIVLTVGVLGGMYPAFFLSSLQPVGILKGHTAVLSPSAKSRSGRTSASLRSVLTTIQFAVAIVFIFAVLVIYRQLGFMKQHDLGFTHDQVIELPVYTADMSRTIKRDIPTIKAEYTRHHSIVAATTHLRSPGRMSHQSEVAAFRDGERTDLWVNVEFTDADFLDAYEIPLLTGRNFSKGTLEEALHQYIINEAAVKAYGWQSPEEAVGNRMAMWDWEGEIIGVIQDFHYWSLHYSIEPQVLLLSPNFFPECLSLRLNTQNLPETLDYIERTTKTLFPGNPFEYYFVDENFKQLYREDEKLGEIFMLFSVLAIVISCLGLFGLALFMAEKKTKEIGIRKVLGASVSGIVLLLSKEFTLRILVANIVAWPVAWLAMNRWLQNFAYRVDVGWWVFVFAGTAVLLIAVLTVGGQAIKAAMANPIESLRYE